MDEIAGLKYFPRMIGKIRLHAAGKLWKELHFNLGKGSDGALIDLMRIDYEMLRRRVLCGGTDEEIFQWCEQQTRPLNATEKLVWNHYVSKLGWNDHISSTLVRRKLESGLAHRNDIQTIAHYIDVDEGRSP